MTTLEPSLVDETIDKIERLTEQFRFQEARELTHFLEDRDTDVDVAALYTRSTGRKRHTSCNSALTGSLSCAIL
jgi:hypothetical protein